MFKGFMNWLERQAFLHWVAKEGKRVSWYRAPGPSRHHRPPQRQNKTARRHAARRAKLRRRRQR